MFVWLKPSYDPSQKAALDSMRTLSWFVSFHVSHLVSIFSVCCYSRYLSLWWGPPAAAWCRQSAQSWINSNPSQQRREKGKDYQQHKRIQQRNTKVVCCIRPVSRISWFLWSWCTQSRLAALMYTSMKYPPKYASPISPPNTKRSMNALFRLFMEDIRLFFKFLFGFTAQTTQTRLGEPHSSGRVCFILANIAI